MSNGIRQEPGEGPGGGGDQGREGLENNVDDWKRNEGLSPGLAHIQGVKP